MRTAFRLVDEIEGLALPLRALIILGDGEPPRVVFELDVDYGRLGMAIMDGKLRPLSDVACQRLAPLLEAYQQASGDDARAQLPGHHAPRPASVPPTVPHLQLEK